MQRAMEKGNDSLMLTTIRDDTWHMVNTQHITRIWKDGIIQTPRWWHLESVGPTHMALDSQPSPTWWQWCMCIVKERAWDRCTRKMKERTSWPWCMCRMHEREWWQWCLCAANAKSIWRVLLCKMQIEAKAYDCLLKHNVRNARILSVRFG